MQHAAYKKLSGFERFEVIYPVVKTYLNASHNSKILDFGCGNGDFAKFLNLPTVWGVDVSSEAVENSKLNNVTAFLIENNSKLPFVNEFFDAVVSNLVFMMMPKKEDVQNSMVELNRVLKSGGRFVFSIVHPCFVDKSHPVFESIFENKFNYSESGSRVKVLIGGVDAEIIDYYRPLEDYISSVLNSGFSIEGFKEIYYGKEVRDLHSIPEELDTYPSYLAISARKL